MLLGIDSFDVKVLAAGNSVGVLAQIKEFQPELVIMADPMLQTKSRCRFWDK